MVTQCLRNMSDRLRDGRPLQPLKSAIQPVANAYTIDKLGRFKTPVLFTLEVFENPVCRKQVRQVALQ